jgi:hypothetical protein
MVQIFRGGYRRKDYLEKARTMFEEMDLQWDLGEYKKSAGTFTGGFKNYSPGNLKPPGELGSPKTAAYH